jgi:uncharacterized membrane protein (Fun14 family)
MDDVQLVADQRGLSGVIGGLPAWSQVAVSLALLAMLGGMGLWAWSVFGSGLGNPDFTRSMIEPSTLTADATSYEEVPNERFELGPALFRLGFAFVLGVVVGLVLRAMLKLFLLLVAALILTAVGLQWAGVLDMEWTSGLAYVNRLAPWLRQEVSNTHDLLLGAIPALLSGALGLLTGFNRR